MSGTNGSSGSGGSTTFYIVARRIHFTDGSAVTMPISFHKTNSEAEAARDVELKKLSSRLRAANKDLIESLGISAIQFAVGSFESQHPELIQVPRLIMPASHLGERDG